MYIVTLQIIFTISTKTWDGFSSPGFAMAKNFMQEAENKPRVK